MLGLSMWVARAAAVVWASSPHIPSVNMRAVTNGIHIMAVLTDIEVSAEISGSAVIGKFAGGG
jgi:hypothetical protein